MRSPAVVLLPGKSRPPAPGGLVRVRAPCSLNSRGELQCPLSKGWSAAGRGSPYNALSIRYCSLGTAFGRRPFAASFSVGRRASPFFSRVRLWREGLPRSGVCPPPTHPPPSPHPSPPPPHTFLSCAP